MVEEDEGMIARDIEHAGERAASKLASTIASTKGINDKAYAVKIRVKTVEDLIEKRKRKCKDYPDYKVTTITDVVGLKVVTLFRSQMLDVVREIVILINEISNTDFINNSIEEIIVYKANKATDDTAEKINETLNALGVPSRLGKDENHKAGYSSIHLVARLTERGRFDESDSLKEYILPIEIQIRTAFEDAWGEIDHEYGYRARTGKRARELGDLSHAQELHLITLKSFVDACADYASAIQADFIGSKMKSPASDVQRINIEDDIAARLLSLGVQDRLVSKFMRIGDVVKLLENESNGSLSSVQNIEVAEKYQTLHYRNTNNKQLTGYARKIFNYYTKMNEGVYRLRAETTTQNRKAIELYEKILKRHSDFPLPYFRLGQAYSKSEQHSRALELFDKAQELYIQLKSSTDENAIDKLPKEESRILALLIPKHKGYLHWKLSKRLGVANEEKCKLLKMSIDETIVDDEAYSLKGSSQGYDEALIDCVNNLLWYKIEFCEMAGKSDEHYEKYNQDAIDHLGYLDNEINIENSTDIRILDTMMTAKEYFNDGALALNIAYRISEVVFPDEDPNQPAKEVNLFDESVHRVEIMDVVTKANRIIRRYTR